MKKIKKLSAIISIIFLALTVGFLAFAIFDSNSFLNNFRFLVLFILGTFTFMTIYIMTSCVKNFNLLNTTLLLVQLSPFLIYLTSVLDVDLLEKSWPLIFVGILLQSAIVYLSSIGFLTKGRKVNSFGRIGAVLTILIVAYTGVLFLLKVSVWSFYAYALWAVIPCYLFFIIAKVRE